MAGFLVAGFLKQNPKRLPTRDAVPCHPIQLGNRWAWRGGGEKYLLAPRTINVSLKKLDVSRPFLQILWVCASRGSSLSCSFIARQLFATQDA